MTGYLRKFVDDYSMLARPLLIYFATRPSLPGERDEPPSRGRSSTNAILAPQVGPDVLPHSTLPDVG